MKRKLQVFLIILFTGIQFFNAQNTEVISKGTKVGSKAIKLKSKRTLNQAKNLNISSKVKASTLKPEDCLIDFETGDCIDPRNVGSLGITQEAGSTAGSLSVSLTGGSSYSIPIMVPPGIKDVAPSIGISYSSQGSNGLAGWGWNVSGLSTISRIPATKYYDNKHDGIDFKDDRFSIDGQRLILKSGSYGANGSVYQTENYSNVKVIAYGSSPYGSTYGPSYFIVYYPNGTRAWYGNSGNSRSRLEWAIFRWQDPQGNYIDYNYQSDNGLLSIKTIKYGGRIGSTSPMNQINFSYVTRSRPENVYVGEYHFRRTNLLKSIQVTSSGSLYRKYELSHYTTSLSYQRLTSIKEYNAENKPLRPITFGYDTTSSYIKDRIVSPKLYPGFNYKTSDLLPGDYDGDGRTDVVFYDKNKKDKLYLHYGLYDGENSFAYPIPTDGFSHVFSSNILSHNNHVLTQQAITTVKETASSSTSNVRFRTYAKAPSGVYIQYDKTWNTSRYQTDNYCNNSTYRTIPKTYVSGDFNGDGLTDVLAVEKQYTTRRCYQNRGCGDDGPLVPIDIRRKETPTKTSEKPSLRRPPIEEDCCNCDSYTRNQYNATVHFIDLKRDVTSNFSKFSGYFRRGVGSKDKILTADHNGDGKQDIYHFKEGIVYIYTLDINNRLVLLHEESDTGIKLDYPILLGDYNGDGKTDFIVATAEKSKNWRFFLSKGKDFYVQTKTLPFGYYKDELLNHHSSWNPAYHSGLHFSKPYYEYRYTAQDVNGDGKTDLIIHNTINEYYSTDKSVEYISIYKNNQSTSSITPSFSYETGYTDTSGEVGKFGFPIFLESNRTNGNLEYGYVSVNNIFMYEFAKDHRKDALLKSITNNGVKVTVEYERLGISNHPYYSPAYTSDWSQKYPYVNINKAPSFLLVKKLTEEGAGIKRYQDFKYQGAVSNVNMGFQGFLKTKRSNWYGDGVGTLWTISKHDPAKRSAVTEQWVSTSSYEGNNYMSKNSTTYSTSLASNKVFTNTPTKVVQHNALSGITTTKNYTYDSFKNLLTESIIYNGGSKAITYTYSNNSNNNSQYYHIGRITKKTETNTIGGNAFFTEKHYSYSNNLLTQQKVKGSGTPWNLENFTYDVFGNVTKKTLSPNGLTARTENYKYDSSGRFLIESTDIEGLKSKFTFDTFGNPTTTTNPYNQITRFSYDGWNRLISERNYLGKTTSFTYAYLSGGGLRKTTNYPQGADEVIEYNALGWTLKTKVLDINNKWIQKSFKYDVSGRTIRESEPYFSSPSQWNSIDYDSYGREITRTSYNGLVANISYNGLVTTVNDGTKTVITTKDGGDNIIKMQDPGGTISYTYYGNGVMKTANYGSHIVKTEIDGWGRKVKLTDPSAGTYTYRYNAIGEVLEETTPKGKTAYTYDAFGKIVTKKLSGEATNMSLNYTYNSTTKLLTSVNGSNLRTNENYTYTYLYDNYKRPSITKEQNGKAYFEHQVTRDSYGRINAETYISKNLSNNVISTVKVRNNFDTNSGILTEIKDYNSNASLWKIKEANARGQAKEVLLGNGMVCNRTYDQFGFLTKILDQTSGSTPKVALNLDYRFDAARGNLTSRKNNGLGWNESFTYDNLDRLTNITGSVNREQRYDGRGRITSNSELGSYNYGTSNSYRLQGVDLNTQGDLYYQNHPVQNITYNAYKKPIAISVEGRAKVDFEYGILQNRSHAYYGNDRDNIADRRYQKHYSGISPVEIEVDKQGNTKIITYIGGDAYGAPVAHIKQTATGKANGYHYVHRDYLNSILAISDSSGTIKEQRQFGAWGTIDKFKRLNSEIDFEHDTTLLRRGYTGHEHFMGVALIHMNGRMYDAQLGRFLSPDNYIQEPFSTQSFNRYGYVWNNPLKYTDPSGEFFWVAVIVGAVIGGTTAAIKGGNFGDILLGALIGGVAAGVGAGVANLAAGGAFFGAKALTVVGFWSGAGVGALSGFAAGFTNASITSWTRGDSFLDGLVSGFRAGVQGAFFGAAVGGITAGIRAGKYDGNFWSGKTELDLSKGFGAHGIEDTSKKIFGKYAGKFEGVDVFESADLGDGFRSGGITLPGKGIVVGTNVIKGAKQNAWLLEHEFGHILQARKVGYFRFYSVIGKESLFSATVNSPEGHGKFWTETWANYLSADYFGNTSFINGSTLHNSLLGYPLLKKPLNWWNWLKLRAQPPFTPFD